MKTLERILIILIVISFFLFLFTLQGCRTIDRVEYVTKYDTVYINKVEKDSVYLKDSVYIYSKADTVFYIKWKERIKYLVKTDTIFEASNDTLYIDRVEYKEVERKRPVRNGFAIFGLVSILSIIGYVFYKIKS